MRSRIETFFIMPTSTALWEKLLITAAEQLLEQNRHSQDVRSLLDSSSKKWFQRVETQPKSRACLQVAAKIKLLQKWLV